MTFRVRRPRRPRELTILFSLLAATLAVAALLAVEALRTARLQRDTATQATQRYASYATWNTARFADVSLMNGLAVAFRQVLRDTIAAELPPFQRIFDGVGYGVACRCVVVLPAEQYFRLDLRTRELSAIAPDGRAASPNEWLRDAVVQHARSNMHDFVAFVVPQGEQPTFVSYARLANRDGQTVGVVGLVARASRVAQVVLESLLRKEGLLPREIGGALPNDSLLAVTVRSAGGATLWRSTSDSRALASDTASMLPWYGSMHVTVGLRASAAGLLPLGHVAHTRTALLVALLVIGTGAVILTALHLRRQHELARVRADFAASVSHELRTPLAQILLYGEMLIFERTRSRQRRRVAAEVIVREARRLMHMVENALHFTRSDRGVPALAPVETYLAPVVSDALVAFAPIAWAADVTIVDNLDQNACALIDRGGMRQILINLLDNAVKQGPAKQTIQVRLIADARVVRLTIEDEGPGIAVADREAIWLPFVRGNGASAQHTGSGIGLTVVRDIVTRLGGRIWVEAGSLGRGARFVVELPAVTVPPTAANEERAKPNDMPIRALSRNGKTPPAEPA